MAQMSKSTKIASALALVVIVVLFIYLTPSILSGLGPISTVARLIIGLFSVFFFFVLALLGVVLTFIVFTLMLTDVLHHYRVRREHREIDLEMHRQQRASYRDHLDRGSSTSVPRRPQIRPRPPDDGIDNGC